MAEALTSVQDMNGQYLFTCLSCSIAFPSAEDQRAHYRSDHHRYNMKRRVALLPPVSAVMFNQKVLERRAETAVQASLKGSTCNICNKVYTTDNAYRSHINSKKHKENESKATAKTQVMPETVPELEPSSSRPPSPPANDVASTQHALEDMKLSNATKPVALAVDDDATEDQINQTIDQKIAAARSRLSSKQCLFCLDDFPSLEVNLQHMSAAHSFFIPDEEYLEDKEGLIVYLGEKISVGNVCIYCNGKGREFRTMDAVRKHMLDKSHCKIGYDTNRDRMELSDFYDFSSSYPDFGIRKQKKVKASKKKLEGEGEEVEGEEWEDMEDDGEEADEIVEESTSGSDDESDDEDDDVPGNQLAYGDSPYELVLPSGARIGHRSLRRYYAQSFARVPQNGKFEDPKSGAALVRKLLGDKNSTLVPMKGGYGAFGAGTQVVKARNRGEAREAGRHVREFRDQRRKEDYKTRVGFVHNHQKHYRDPLLQ